MKCAKHDNLMHEVDFGNGITQHVCESCEWDRYNESFQSEEWNGQEKGAAMKCEMCGIAEATIVIGSGKRDGQKAVCFTCDHKRFEKEKQAMMKCEVCLADGLTIIMYDSEGEAVQVCVVCGEEYYGFIAPKEDLCDCQICVDYRELHEGE